MIRQPLPAPATALVTVAALFCGALAGLAGPPETLAQEADASAGPNGSVTITTITGERREIGLLRIADGTIQTGDGTLPLDQTMEIATGRPLVPVTGGWQVYLSRGGSLPVTGVQFSGEEFRITARWGASVLGPESVAGILLDPSADRLRFDTALQNRSGDHDLVIASTSEGQQAVEGLLESIDRDRLMLNYQGRSRPVSLSRVVGIVTADLRPASPADNACQVRLVDGGSIAGSLRSVADGKLQLELSAGIIFTVPWSQVTRVLVSSDRVAWLSDLEPVSADHAPLAGPPFEWQRDTSVDGNPLTLVWPSTGEAREFGKGIGTRPASRIEFDNSGGFQRLVATVGIDAETGGKGHCEVIVQGDGIRLWSAEISGSTDPVPVDIEITGMNRIALIVRNGKFLDLGDHVDWADARFVKTNQQ